MENEENEENEDMPGYPPMYILHCQCGGGMPQLSTYMQADDLAKLNPLPEEFLDGQWVVGGRLSALDSGNVITEIKCQKCGASVQTEGLFGKKVNKLMWKWNAIYGVESPTSEQMYLSGRLFK